MYIKCELGEKPKDIPYITIEDVRLLLDLEETKYKTTTNLISAVLKPAIEAINRDTGMQIELQLYKRERKTIGFRFVIPRHNDIVESKILFFYLCK